MQRNVALYPLFRVAADAHAWIPVFFLYFSQRLSMAEVLLLESVYYFAVVVAEVPSGYFSDVLGRRKTLLLSSATMVVGYLFFLGSDAFVGFAMGQILFALANAFRSGTDTSFHYESLATIGREAEYGDREAKAGQYGFLSTSIAALAGGVLGSYDLSWPYWFSLATALAAIGVVVSFTEPQNQSDPAGAAKSAGFIRQLAECGHYMRSPLLCWLFAYYVFMYTIVHVPFEFYQPYLALLGDSDRLAGYSAPLVAGIIFAITAFVGSLAARFSMVLRRRLGLVSLLSWALIVELGVIAALAFWLHPVLAAMVILRNGPMAVIAAPINAATAPRVSDAHRATYLSLRSLAARLGFAAMLAGFAALMPVSGDIEWPALSTALRVALIIGVVGLVLLVGSSKWLANNKNLGKELFASTD